ncbi:hypothetical protein GCM10009737_18700 [Nocardioides lentus]|uniref:VTT domain-containing protein n=1 Tax=Nocardioides lentus TaxID=338077 RepID=A0ABN2PCC4_9ACTN
MSSAEITPVTLLVLYGVVAFGAVVPVLPTGAAVSSAAVLAGHEQALLVLVVVAVGAVAAWTGDVVVYRVLATAGVPFARRMGWWRQVADGTGRGDRAGTDHEGDDGDDQADEDDEGVLLRLREGIERHEVRTLLVSRLVPGGRIPVLMVAALTGYPWQRFVGAAVAAAALWSAVYAAVGVLGSAVVPDDRVALVVALVGALALTVVVRGVRLVVDRVRTRLVRTPA